MAVNNLNKAKIPGTGTTAARPSNPAVGDTYYNGTLGRLEIYTSQGWMALSAPPQTPTGVTATDAGSGRAYNNGSASIAFTPATAGGLPTSYVVTSSPGSYTATGSASPIIVSGQQSNTSYTYTVVASNDFGTASASSASSAVTATTIPQTPTIGAVTGGNASANVAYTANGTGGLSNTYTATSSPGGLTGTGSSPITVSGLTNGTSYTFTVTATNANGTSAASAASSSVTPAANIFVDYLVVAGGGGGAAGGGGAGGLRSTVTATGGGCSLESALNLSPSTNYTVTVGAGGSGRIAYGTGAANGDNGSNSVFSTITSLGGGGGGAAGGGTGQPATGGSGGGASYSSGQGIKGLGTACQGYDGGEDTTDPPPYVGPGGGGAGQPGQVPASTSIAGAGGNGVAVAITGSSVYYAGGGGGFGYGGGTAGAGGLGGGGTRNVQNDGTANTGGGGSATSNGGQGGSGGSGIVILRYPDTFTISIGAGLTGTESSASGGYKRASITAGTGNVSWT